MSRYIDGFVLPVPKDKLDEYRKLAELASTVWREHGALEYVECVAEDVKPGKLTSFPQSVQLKDDETVIFAWIAYSSRAERDRINQLAINDPRLNEMAPENMPFDAKRMFWGGFETLVETSQTGLS